VPHIVGTCVYPIVNLICLIVGTILASKKIIVSWVRGLELASFLQIKKGGTVIATASLMPGASIDFIEWHRNCKCKEHARGGAYGAALVGTTDYG